MTHAHQHGCLLCGLPVRGDANGFCCIGCRHACDILKEIHGLQDPKAMRKSKIFLRMQAAGVIPKADDPPPPSPEPKDRAEVCIPDGEPVESRVLKVDDMWCPSCSWMIERVVGQMEGVIEVTASFHSDRVKIVYLPRLVGTDKLAEKVRWLGYRVVEEDDQKAREKKQQRQLLRLGLSIFLTVNVMMLSFGLYQGFLTELSSASIRMIGFPILAMATLVIFFGGYPILYRAVQAARARSFVMETLTSLGALSAYGLSVAHLLAGDLHLYFDTASMLVTLVLLGKYIEQRLRYRASRGIEEIYTLVPTKARLLRQNRERFVSIEGISPGDAVRVRSGEVIPADGQVVTGDGVADESKLTGENRPAAKHPGDTCIGGSLLVSGQIDFRVSHAGQGSTIGRMVALMEQTLVAKNPAERLADRTMAFFVPAVIALAGATCAALILTGHAYEQALVRAVTVLVIACPCALGIATPLAKVATVGRARRAGILVTNADALEIASRLDVMVLDKTGTMTTGVFSVRDVVANGATKQEVIELAAAAEAASDHPIARALRDFRANQNINSHPAQDSRVEPGMGVTGTVDGRQVRVGNAALMRKDPPVEIPTGLDRQAKQWAGQGNTAVFIAWGNRVRGVVALGDALRESMHELVENLVGQGRSVHLVSGDAVATTNRVADTLGIAEFKGGFLPADKVAYITQLQAKGHRVGMVGDGANDAAALAAADVGFATGDALTVTKNASDLTLLSFSGEKLLQALSLSHLAVRTIRTNLGLAVVYNLVALPLALAGIVNPVIAVSAMLLSSLTVVGNSARIARG